MNKNTNKDVLAIIPARKNSKGIRFKNKKLLMGKPLIAYTIEAAIESGIVDILVASDDDEILRISESYGLETDYMRPESVSDDEASMDSVILDVISYIKEKKFSYNYAMTLQPTSPFRTSQDILNAVELVKNTSKCVVGVSKMMHHPYECIEEGDSTRFGLGWTYLARPFSKKNRRQDYEDRYWFINGAIYCYSIDNFIDSGGFNWDNSIIYKMGIENSIDIDTDFEFAIAEDMMKNKIKND